jgi:CBS domain-containing protein
MKPAKKVKDLMDDIFDYPHLPYWFSLKQTIDILKKAGSGTNAHPLSILIFDERYNLLGTLCARDIYKVLEIKFKALLPESQPSMEDESEIFRIIETICNDTARALLEKPVSDFMVPVRSFLEPEDTTIKAADLMIQHNLICLPVLEDKKKLVGIIKKIKVCD